MTIETTNARRTVLIGCAALLLLLCSGCGRLERPTPPTPFATATAPSAGNSQQLPLPAEAIGAQYSADGATLAVLTRSALLAVDSASWQPLWQAAVATRAAGPTVSADGQIHVITWQPSGNVAVQSWRADGSDAGLDVVNSFQPVSVALSPDGQLLALANAQNELALYDRAAATLTPLVAEGSGQIMLLAFSPSGDRLAVDFSRGSSLLIDLADGTTLQQLGEWMEGRSYAFTEDGGKLAIAWWGPPIERAIDGGHEWIQPQGLQLWAIPGGRTLYEEVDLDRTIGAIAPIPGNELLAVARDNGSVFIRRWADGGDVRTFDLDTRRIQAIAAAPDGHTLAVAGQQQSDGAPSLWRLALDQP